MPDTSDPTTAPLRGDVFVSFGLPPDLIVSLSDGRPVVILDPSQISKDQMNGLRHAQMGCELFQKNGDALTIIEALRAAGATGHLLIVAPRIPDPAMVERELRKAAKGFSVSLIEG